MKAFTILATGVGFLPWFLLPANLRAEEPAPQRPLINLQFPGGTVAEYVEAVLKTTKDINIVVMPEAREFEVPPLQLTAVDVGSAMALLNGRNELKGRGVVKLNVEEIEPFQGYGQAIFTISSGVGPPDAERPDEAGVWTISELLSADMKAQDVLTAIQTAVDLISEQYGTAEIRFHEATGLVIARGHDRQMETVERVIKRLREGLRPRRAPGSSAEEAPKEEPEAQSAKQSKPQEAQTQKMQMLMQGLIDEIHALRMDLSQRPVQPQSK